MTRSQIFAQNDDDTDDDELKAMLRAGNILFISEQRELVGYRRMASGGCACARANCAECRHASASAYKRARQERAQNAGRSSTKKERNRLGGGVLVSNSAHFFRSSAPAALCTKNLFLRYCESQQLLTLTCVVDWRLEASELHAFCVFIQKLCLCIEFFWFGLFIYKFNNPFKATITNSSC